MSSQSTLVWFLESATEARGAGEWEEALLRYETSLSRVSKEGDARVASEILRGIGNVHYARGDFENAREVFQVSLSIAEVCELKEETVSALNCLAVVDQYAGAIDEAEGLYIRARDIAEELGDARREAMIEQNLGTLANIRGDVELALERYQRAFDRFTEQGDLLATARSLCNMGMAYVDLGAWAPAERCFADAYRIANRIGDREMLGTVEINRSELYLRCDRLDEGLEACDRAFELFTNLESKAGLAEASKFYGAILRRLRKHDLAATHLELAAQLSRLCRDRLLEAEVERERAMLHSEAGRNREALRSLNIASDIFREFRASRELPDIDRQLNLLESAYLQSARHWAARLEAEDPFATGRAERVSEYACLLAEEMGIRGRELTRLRLAGLLHDVGKTELLDEMPLNSDDLTADEWALVNSSVDRSERIVSDLNLPWDMIPIVRGRHEKWDGSGYPDGLHGREIPLHARIIAVAEAYDALTTDSNDHVAVSSEEALRRLDHLAGVSLDPHLVELLRREIENAAGDSTVELIYRDPSATSN